MDDTVMRRDVSKLHSGTFDVLVVGGGIYGSWIAFHAATTGLRVALVEQSDWGSATSSASSKLLHGGLRYLERFEFGLVRKSLHERRELNRLLPHHVHPLRFLLPVYRHSRVGRFRLKAGLWLYDRLAGANQPVARHQSFSASGLLKQESGLKPDDLRGGFSYGDCGTDDARMILEVVDSAVDAGAVACHYVSADELLTTDGHVTGVRLRDRETENIFDVKTSVVVNAAGPWVFRQFGQESETHRVRLTKGVHLVMPALQSNHAILLTAKSDGRVFFLIPWYGRTLLGTTDTDFSGDPADVRVERDDVTYLLAAANNYLRTPWTVDDIYSAFVGLRTLQNANSETASGVSREWSLEETLPGLLTSVGGKYTSARVDAAEAVGQVLRKLQRAPGKANATAAMAWFPDGSFADWLQRVGEEGVSVGMDRDTALQCARRHGARFTDILNLVRMSPTLSQRIVSELPFCRAEVVHAATHEMARTLVDILRRRIPLMLLIRLQRQTVEDACHLVADVLQWDAVRREQEIANVLDAAHSWQRAIGGVS